MCSSLVFPRRRRLARPLARRLAAAALVAAALPAASRPAPAQELPILAEFLAHGCIRTSSSYHSWSQGAFFLGSRTACADSRLTLRQASELDAFLAAVEWSFDGWKIEWPHNGWHSITTRDGGTVTDHCCVDARTFDPIRAVGGWSTGGGDIFSTGFVVTTTSLDFEVVGRAGAAVGPTVAPEPTPGALLAVAGGLAALAGAVARRRPRG